MMETNPNGAEKSANGAGSSATTTAGKPSSTTTATAPRLRSCVICRKRKVRCDKQSPCSNCRRAGIACAAPPTDRPPRWARRLDRFANTGAGAVPSTSSAGQAGMPGIDKVMDRLRTLEGLVKDLNGQLEEARGAASVGGSSSPRSSSSAPSQSLDGASQQSRLKPGYGDGESGRGQGGKIGTEKTDRTRYLSSGFWSRVNNEVRLTGCSKSRAGLGH